MPSAAFRAAHRLTAGSPVGRQQAAARSILLCLFAAAWFVPLGAADATAADTCLQQIAVQPGRQVDIAVGAPRLLIEEVGTDIEYRWNTGEDFTAVATPPDRLGFDVLAARSSTLTLRVREGQGGGQVRIGNCLGDADAAFFSGLAALQTRSLEAGRDAARAALPALTYLRRWPLDTRHAGWVSSAHANVLASAGENNAAETAFLDSSRDWQQAGRPDRAAIALMAAGDNASRANRFDVAREWLTQARDELQRLGVTYYVLRSEGSLCTVLAREGRHRDAIACEERVIARWNAQQEKREAAVREISVANLRLRFGEFDEAQQHLLRAETAESALTPPLRARLQTALGNLALGRGDLPDAAKRYAQAVQLLGNGGLPADQANLDLKLANLARFAGASPERLRLLQAAGASLKTSEDPLRLAEIGLLLGETHSLRGDAMAALAAAEDSAAVCSKRAAADCIDDAALMGIRALLDLGRIDSARTRLAARAGDPRAASPRWALLAARLDLADGDPQRALQRLSPVGGGPDDPELQAEQSLLVAQALAMLGRRKAAVERLRTTLLTQAAQAARWPSAALRISARGRLARLQSALFDQVLANADDAIAADDFVYVKEAVDAAAATQLFADAGGTPLPPPLREALSAAAAGGGFTRQRELLAALAANDAAALPAKPPASRRIATAAADPAVLVLVPLAGASEFHLLAVRAGHAQRCLRWPVARYDDLAARFAAALDGETDELTALQAEAESIHASIRRCSDGTAAPSHWQVVRIAGAPALPWAWIAAAVADAAGEPTVTQTLAVSAEKPPLAKPSELLLLDLDMPQAAPLPLASREMALLDAELQRHGIAVRPLHAADRPAEAVLAELAAAPVVHVIGHANPAAFGQLYQGLWYEAAGKPSLLTYPEIAALRIRAGLVVLSACGTHAAATASSGTSAHLAEAFIAAGASHVVAAANPLSDAAAPLWATRFHEVLWSGADVATAAREARAALRASPHFRSPRYWAGIEHFSAATEFVADDVQP